MAFVALLGAPGIGVTSDAVFMERLFAGGDGNIMRFVYLMASVTAFDMMALNASQPVAVDMGLVIKGYLCAFFVQRLKYLCLRRFHFCVRHDIRSVLLSFLYDPLERWNKLYIGRGIFFFLFGGSDFRPRKQDEPKEDPDH